MTSALLVTFAAGFALGFLGQRFGRAVRIMFEGLRT